MAKLFSEKAWLSTKVGNIQPVEWRPEYAWLMAISFVDGTFEADPRRIWSLAYAYNRPDWTAENVAKLLDELERVGLLLRTKDDDGRVWGFWVGADQFAPPPSHAGRYKNIGKRSLFDNIKDTSSSPPDDIKQPSKRVHQGLGVGSGSGLGKGVGTGVGLGSGLATENEQKPEQIKTNPKSNGVEALSLSGPDLDLKATPTPKPAPMKTIGEHFMGDLTIGPLTNYELDHEELARWFTNDDGDLLEECIAAAVAAKTDRPYRGPKTNAELMGDTMKLLRDTYDRDVPKPWVPVMQTLRDSDKVPLAKKQTVPSSTPSVRQEPSPWHKANGYERCADEIWRPKADREALGFTVKDKYEIWRKPEQLTGEQQ